MRRPDIPVPEPDPGEDSCRLIALGLWQGGEGEVRLPVPFVSELFEERDLLVRAYCDGQEL